MVINDSITPLSHTFNRKVKTRNKNVSYNLLANDQERSNQLMKIFEKKLNKMGHVQEVLKEEDLKQKKEKLEVIEY